jgi:hypothetical protein
MPSAPYVPCAAALSRSLLLLGLARHRRAELDEDRRVLGRGNPDTHQYLAFPGVLGNGIASRTFVRPVA